MPAMTRRIENRHVNKVFLYCTKGPQSFDLRRRGFGQSAKIQPIAGPACDKASEARPTLERRMITSLVAGEPNDHLCSECSIRQLGVCAALDKADLRELAHLSRRFQYSAGETVFAQEEMTTSFYKLLDDTALQAAARWSPADHWICPASRDWRHQSNFSADAVRAGYSLPVLQVRVCAI